MNIKKVVIVGGGTSGWLSAALLLNHLKGVEIVIVDKEVGTPVGVGEGTLINFADFLLDCGFPVSDWFSKIDATYKSAILFPGWNGENKEVWHPFFKGTTNLVDNISVQDVWTNHQDLEYEKYALGFYEASVVHKTVDTDRLDLYAFHVDASKLVQYIKSKIADKITFIQSDVVDIIRDESNIKNLQLKNGMAISADLYVDCTGFKHILNDRPERVEVTNRLFCDTAIAGHVPYKNREQELNPYVISDQVDHGWVWNIPVKNRIGSGLVFNRSITDIEEAKKYFIQYWDNRISEENVKVIDWTPYYNLNQWRGNTVAVGLSAGFIEPLESTGITLIMAGISKLRDLIIDNQYTQNEIDFFNLQMKIYFEDCIDFVSMHYSKPWKKTKFWDWVKETWVTSERFEYYKSVLADGNVPMPSNGKFSQIFGGSNWACWLTQMGHPVAERGLPFSSEQTRKLLLDYHTNVEKHRHVWSRKHCEEVDRLSDAS